MRLTRCLLAFVALGALAIAPADARHRKGRVAHQHHHSQKSDKAEASPKGPHATDKSNTLDAWIDTHAKRPKPYQKAKGNGSKARFAIGGWSKRHHLESGRNAIGAAVNQDKPDALRNAAGLGTTPVPNPFPGTRAAVVSSAPGGGWTPPAPGIVRLPDKPPINAALNHAAGQLRGVPGAGVNGATMIRPAFRASIGGAPRNTAGVISGNSFQPRHP